MSIFTRAFNVLARKNHVPAPAILSDEYERPVFPAPPVPTGEWSLLVDENGDRVTTRQPLPTDMLARPPIGYHFGGTLPKFKMQPGSDIVSNVPGVIDYETRSQINKEHLDKAVFLLSQTDDGRRLLQKAHYEKFTFVFDRDGAGREGAAGLCDFNAKLIPLAEGHSPAEVALTLKHELQHMEDMLKGAGYSSWDKPQTARMMDRTMEANARVSEAVAAAEILLGDPKGPARQFRTPALFRNFWRGNQPMAEEAHGALKLASKGKWKEFALKVFPAYLKQTQTLDYYDWRYAHGLLHETPDITADQQKAEKGQYHERDEAKRRIQKVTENAENLFKFRKTAQDIAGMMMLRGLPYLDGATLENPAMQQVSFAARGVLEQVKQRLAKILPGTDKTALLDAPERGAEVPATLPNPYQGFPSEIAGYDAVRPIILPNRIDGAAHTNGQKMNAEATEWMANAFKNMRSGKTDTDRLSHCIGDYIRRAGGTANMRGIVGELLEAGLRAPVCAFPREYVRDLYSRMYSSVQVGATGESSGLSRQEIRLVRHWQEMKDNGLDPIWISKENKAQSYLNDDREIDLYGGYLVKGLKTSENKVAESDPAPAKVRSKFQ